MSIAACGEATAAFDGEKLKYLMMMTGWGTSAQTETWNVL
jgi:hypothetical protein